MNSIIFSDGHILLVPPLKLVVQNSLKPINIGTILHHLLSIFKIGKPNKTEMLCCYSLAA